MHTIYVHHLCTPFMHTNLILLQASWRVAEIVRGEQQYQSTRHSPSSQVSCIVHETRYVQTPILATLVFPKVAKNATFASQSCQKRQLWFSKVAIFGNF